MMKSRTILACMVLAFLMAGCFPSTVSVGPDGRVALPTGDGIYLISLKDEKADQIYESEKGKEVAWVQWAPDGKKLLYAVGNEIMVTSPEGKNTRSVYTSKGNMGYCLWSHNGKLISVADVETKMDFSELEKKSPDETVKEEAAKSEDKKEEDKTGIEKEALPGLSIFDAESGKVLCSVKNISLSHRWMADDKSLILFHILKKDKDTGNFLGDIARLNVSDGSLTPLVHVESNESWVDVPSSGECVFFNARDARLDEKKKESQEDTSQKLYCYNFDTRKLTEIAKGVAYLSISPDSKHVLLVRDGEEGVSELVTIDPSGEGETVLARDIACQSSDMGGGKILPAWLDNSEVLYWKYVTILSPGGKSLTAYTGNLKTQKTTKIHPALEKCISQAKKVFK